MTLRVTSATFILFMFFSSSAFAELKNGMDAEVVVGQPDFTTATSGTGSNKFNNQCSGISTDGKKLFVTDFGNHRVLIYDRIPFLNNQISPTVVVGQSDFTTATNGLSQTKLNFPREVFSDGKKLFVSDTSNRRLLIWNQIPTTNLTPADVVLGQPDFASSTANNGGLSASTFNANSPRGLFSDGKKLFVCERGNHRVLIWNSIPTTNFAPADVVLGQPDFISNTANNGGRSARTLNTPLGVFSDGKKLFVADFGNNRVLIYNSIPSSNFAAADSVLGQTDFTSATAKVSRTNLNGPAGGVSDGKRLFVVDFNNNRILVWNSNPIVNNAPADIVLGQPDFTTSTAGTTSNKLNGPLVVSTDGKKIFISEASNIRALIFNLASESAVNLGPQFNQGKAVLGKVFEDWNGNGLQDESATKASADKSVMVMAERGIEGVKIVSDTGIYAITDSDGKYHFPYIETGQHILKLDPSTLAEGSALTTESPRKITVTKGILTKVSFGVKPKPETLSSNKENPSPSNPLLKVSISQDPAILKPTLSLEAKPEKDKLLFTLHCNYFLFVERAEIKLFDRDLKLLKTFSLPKPLPYRYEIPLKSDENVLYYQLSVWNKEGKEDRTGVGKILLPEKAPHD